MTLKFGGGGGGTSLYESRGAYYIHSYSLGEYGLCMYAWGIDHTSYLPPQKRKVSKFPKIMQHARAIDPRL